MTKQEIWRQLVERYPEWKDPDHVVKLKAKGLKALIDQAWSEGYDAVLMKGSESDEDPTLKNPFSGLFDGLWKK